MKVGRGTTRGQSRLSNNSKHDEQASSVYGHFVGLAFFGVSAMIGERQDQIGRKKERTACGVSDRRCSLLINVKQEHISIDTR